MSLRNYCSAILFIQFNLYWWPLHSLFPCVWLVYVRLFTSVFNCALLLLLGTLALSWSLNTLWSHQYEIDTMIHNHKLIRNSNEAPLLCFGQRNFIEAPFGLKCQWNAVNNNKKSSTWLFASKSIFWFLSNCEKKLLVSLLYRRVILSRLLFEQGQWESAKNSNAYDKFGHPDSCGFEYFYALLKYLIFLLLNL